LLTGMRSAVLGTFFGLLFVAACARWKGLLLFLGGGALSLGLLLALLPYLPMSENLARIVGRGERAAYVEASNSAHVSAFWDSIHVVGTHPITGVGFSEGQAAHNLFLQTINLGGVVALVGLFVIWGTYFLLMVQRLSVGFTREGSIPTFLLGAVVGYFVIAQFEPLIWDRHLWFFLILALYAQRPSPAEPEVRSVESLPQLGVPRDVRVLTRR
jgi:hypothetical protein